jgi:tetratricopeptide (TPR) repeat protein
MSKKSVTEFVLIVLLGIGIIFPLFSQSDDIPFVTEKVNRQTALRCLAVCKTYVSEGLWDSASETASTGIVYDGSVGDLWYIKALCAQVQGKSKAEQIQLITTALNQSSWFDYNRDSGRLFLASLLVETGKSQEVIQLLSNPTILLTSDSTYIKAKAYYNLHDFEKAREVIDSGRRMYPKDTRFPLLFFTREIQPLIKGTAVDAEVAFSLATKLIGQYKSEFTTTPDLFLFSSFFASKEESVKFLEAYDASGNKNPWYGVYALSKGILTQEKALLYMESFFQTQISYDCLDTFLSLLTEEILINQLQNFFLSFEGTIEFDTDSDFIPNMVTKYHRGRPLYISYDFEQDDVLDWEIECDFGEPYLLRNFKDDCEILYSPWPFIQQIKTLDGKVILELTYESEMWKPVDIQSNEVLFIPVLSSSVGMPSWEELKFQASVLIVPATEIENGQIRYSCMDGKFIDATYFDNNTVFAYCAFIDGIPDYRSVDVDRDGVYEMIQVFGYDSSLVSFLQRDEKVLESVYGLIPPSPGVYVSKIIGDFNKDSFYEYSEEYIADDGVRKSWDMDKDGIWDTQYVEYVQKKWNLSRFIDPVTKQEVAVESLDGKPIAVLFNGTPVVVSKESDYDFYWIGTVPENISIEKIVETVNQNPYSFVYQTVYENIFVVKYGQIYYGVVTE